MRFDLTDLRLFLAVVDAGSITHGASAAGLSLAAASERLRDMEADGGVRLLDRGPRGVTPTEAGGALVHHARQVLHQLAQLREEIGQFASGLRRSVRVLANTSALTEILPQRLAPWLAANPQIDVDLRDRQSVDIARSIRLGFGEIGIMSDAVDSSGLRTFPFASDRLVVVTSPQHRLAGRASLRLAELDREPWVGLASGALKEHLDQHATRLAVKLTSRVQVSSFGDICRMAGHGVGVGIVPVSAATRHRNATGIAVVDLAEDWAARRLSLCVRDSAELSAAAQSLLAHLTQS